jgi:hypothetical protein
MPSKHYSRTIGGPLPEIGAHSIAKHDVFARYVGRQNGVVSYQISSLSIRSKTISISCALSFSKRSSAPKSDDALNLYVQNSKPKRLRSFRL